MKSSTARRVLILELGASGHHPRLVRWLLESAVAESAEIILASRREMFEHAEIRACTGRFTRHQIGLEPELDARLRREDTAGLLYRSWIIGNLYRKVCAAVAREAHVDFAIVPYFDDCILGLAVPHEAFGGIPWMTITMRTRFHYSEMGLIAPRQRLVTMQRLFFYRVLKQKSMTALFTIDPTLAEFAEKRRGPLLRKVEYLPDPTARHPILPSKTEARQQLAIPPDARVILLYGELSVRKGILSLLQALTDGECSRQVHVLMAGRFLEPDPVIRSEAYQNLIAEGRIHVIQGYLDDGQERQVLAAADCSWVGYIGFYGMSGMMALSGSHGVPVLGSPEGLIGYLTRKYEIGVVIDPRNRQSVVNALNRLVTEPQFFLCAGKNAVLAFQKHAFPELQRIVTEKVLQSWSCS
jgi:glycosyltransferase involved in cell wall biosynthesis